MRIKFLFIIVTFFIVSLFYKITSAAPFLNSPYVVSQPDGTPYECYITGDEFYSWLHDVDGYPIVQDKNTGFYVYAINQSDELLPTKYVLGSIDPALFGLQKGVTISEKKINEIKEKQYKFLQELPTAAPTIGTINNIVVFIRFSDEDEFNQNISVYEDIFNSTSAGSNSLYNYYYEVSYQQLIINSTFYPNPSPPNVVSFQDSHPRDYFRPYQTSNPDGYPTVDEGNARIQQLAADAINYISGDVPANLNIDQDNDGNVDNVCLIVYGSKQAGELLFPYTKELYAHNVYINGKKVNLFNLNFQNDSQVSVIAHEMFHSLGAPDLYEAFTTINPMYKWDIMSFSSDPPEHPSAYIKYKYGKWINYIPEIVEAGTYTLNPLTNSTNNCYKIESPYSNEEFFVIEYRKFQGTFENSTSLPGEGLLIYKVNKNSYGNYAALPFEIYAYRPNGTLTQAGDYNLANFSANSGRTIFNDLTSNPICFLSDGHIGGIDIQDIGYTNSTINFTVNSYTFPDQFVLETGITSLVNVRDGSVAWGDYNNDDYLDLFITGNTVPGYPTSPTSQLYINDGNENFYNSNIYFEPNEGMAKWGDFNNDGNLDIVICGYNGTAYVTKLYKNEGTNNFTPLNVNLLGVVGSVDWGDYDNDGYLDLLICGSGYTRVYKNNGDETFTPQNSFGLIGVSNGAANWGDVNGDGYLDIFLTGQQNATTNLTTIYYNEEGLFNELDPIDLPDLMNSFSALADYDNDGDLDVYLSGISSSSSISALFRNDGNNTFYELPIDFNVLGKAVWGDYDNDGDLDLILAGNSRTRYYKNQGNDNFSLYSLSLGDYAFHPAISCADYDKDDDLDFIITGYDLSNNVSTRIYNNEEYSPNSKPIAPVNLTTTQDATGVTFSWFDASYYDDETPYSGLTFNLVVTRVSGGNIIVEPMSNQTTGFRKLVKIGNTGHRNSWKLKNIGPGFYNWTVQTIDNSFAASAFAYPIAFVNYTFPVELSSFEAKLADGQVELYWKTETEVNNYGFEIERALDNVDWGKIGFVEGNGNSNSPKFYSFTDNNPIGGSKFYYRLKQIDTDGAYEYSSVVEIEIVPTEFGLYQNYPNPFNPNTMIRYRLPKESEVEIKIYDMLGSEIMTLVNEKKEIGIYEVEFSSLNLSSGTYIYRMAAGDFMETKKMILIK